MHLSDAQAKIFSDLIEKARQKVENKQRIMLNDSTATLDSMGPIIRDLAEYEVWLDLSRAANDYQKQNGNVTVEFITSQVGNLSIEIEKKSRKVEASQCQISNGVERHRLAAMGDALYKLRELVGITPGP